MIHFNSKHVIHEQGRRIQEGAKEGNVTESLLRQFEDNYFDLIPRVDPRYYHVRGPIRLASLYEVVLNAAVHGGDKVDLSTYQKDGSLIVTVKDHGEGIPEGRLKEVQGSERPPYGIGTGNALWRLVNNDYFPDFNYQDDTALLRYNLMTPELAKRLATPLAERDT